jgi:membrane-anchored protein YejM (alkaline phosphatase superfamily)
MAFRMQFEAQEVFDLNHEPKNIREGYGSSPFAQACLTARRLVERGVRVVQIFTGGGQPWDNHDDIAQHRQLAQQTDQPIAMLLKDLKSKGMLDETLVLWGGEFGRTPTSEGSKGRDHIIMVLLFGLQVVVSKAVMFMELATNLVLQQKKRKCMYMICMPPCFI